MSGDESRAQRAEQGWTLTSGHRDPPLPPPAPTIAAAAAGAAGDERSGVNI